MRQKHVLLLYSLALTNPSFTFKTVPYQSNVKEELCLWLSLKTKSNIANYLKLRQLFLHATYLYPYFNNARNLFISDHEPRPVRLSIKYPWLYVILQRR
jgi:hypothetical protein